MIANQDYTDKTAIPKERIVQVNFTTVETFFNLRVSPSKLKVPSQLEPEDWDVIKKEAKRLLP